MSVMTKKSAEPDHQMLVKRREFLSISALVAGWSVLTTTVAATVWSARDAAASSMPEGIRFMSPNEYRVMERLMRITLPTEGTELPNTADLPVLQVMDGALLGGMEPHILAGLKAGIQYFDAGPNKEYNGQFFAELSDQDAIRFCDAWADGDAEAERGLSMGLKKLIGLAYWSNPATWPALGYGGPYSVDAGIEPQGNAVMPV